jgi:hypothetical protein
MEDTKGTIYGLWVLILGAEDNRKVSYGNRWKQENYK